MTAYHHTQVLLEPEQRRALSRIAQQDGRSISDVLRQIIREYPLLQDEGARQQCELEALENLTHIRLHIQEQQGVYPANFLEETRNDRHEDYDRLWRVEA